MDYSFSGLGISNYVVRDLGNTFLKKISFISAIRFVLLISFLVHFKDKAVFSGIHTHAHKHTSMI